MSSYYVEDLEVQSGKASPGKRRSSPDPETKVSGKLATEEETNRDGKYPTPYTSQNPWTILGSSGQIRIRHLKHANPDILVFACSDKAIHIRGTTPSFHKSPSPAIRLILW